MAESVDVLVIGAGQAGLAASYWLGRHGVDHALIDRASGYGESWKARWDSLEMITPNWMNGLPGAPYPGPPDGFSPKATTVEFLRRYGESLRAPVRWGVPVLGLHQARDGLVAQTPEGPINAHDVIVATGPYQSPRVPEAAASLTGVVQFHSSTYRNPDQVPTGQVLVVGSGNSGVWIARELAATGRDVVLACGSNPRVPRRVTGHQLIQTMGAIAAQELKIPEGTGDREADLMRWLDDVGFFEMTADTPLGARISGATSDAYFGPPLTEVAAEDGIRLTGRVLPGEDGRLATADGTSLTPSAVVWATGFGTDFSWISVPVFGADGRLRHVRGVSGVPGLYFVGLRFLHTASSSTLYGVGRDTWHIVEHIIGRPRSDLDSAREGKVRPDGYGG